MRNENFQTQNEKIPDEEIFAPPTSNIYKNIYIGDVGKEKEEMSAAMKRKFLMWLGDMGLTDGHELENAVNEFLKYRRQRKKAMTDVAFTRFLNQLQKVSGCDAAVMRDCIDTAILHGWDTVYPPREGGGAKAATAPPERTWL